MVRIIVDSSSCIKQVEQESYGIEILPVRIQIAGCLYRDGIDLESDYFAGHNRTERANIQIPSQEQAENMVEEYLRQGDEVLILTAASGLFGTYQRLRDQFSDYKQVLIYDTGTIGAGMRFLLEEANCCRDLPLCEIAVRLNLLRPKIELLFVPVNLDYLLAGGWLTRSEWIRYKLFSSLPVVRYREGKAEIIARKRGIIQGMQAITAAVIQNEIDPVYGMIGMYSGSSENLTQLISALDNRQLVRMFNEVNPSIAGQCGPDAFGVAYVRMIP